MIEEAVAEIESLLLPLEEEAIKDIVALVRGAVTHQAGASVGARRALEALAAKAAIDS